MYDSHLTHDLFTCHGENLPPFYKSFAFVLLGHDNVFPGMCSKDPDGAAGCSRELRRPEEKVNLDLPTTSVVYFTNSVARRNE